MYSRWLLQLHAFLEDLADQIEKRRVWFLAGFSILYLAVTGLVASQRPLWNDELYTLYIARLHSMTDVWDALSTGAEQLPPLFYVLTRASLALFGTNELSLRLPEVIGFWIMGLCLFRFVCKCTPGPYGSVAMLFPLVTGAYYYATEARPYGLVLGFSGLALLCWQAATERDRRLLCLAGLAASLAAAISCHYHAVFVLGALAFAEAVRSRALRRLDLPLWAALSLSVAPLLAFFPLIRRAIGYSATFWAKSRWMSAPEFYYSLLAPAVLPLMALLVLSAAYPTTMSSRRRGARHAPRPDPHEMAAAFGFLAIPIVAVTVSMLTTESFTDRYALPAVIGCSLIVAFAAHKSLYGRPATVTILTLFLFGCFLSLGGKSFTTAMAIREANAQAIQFLRSKAVSDLPIAVSDQHAFMSLAHYAPRDISSRLVYLADPDKALYHLGHNSVEKGTLALLKPWFHLPIEEYERFLASGRSFFVYGDSGHFLNWLLPDLIASCRHLELSGQNKASLLFLVTPGKGC
jgi:4-amino-4-deoxy-L-arabinose transferase-like glycosyltransferase